MAAAQAAFGLLTGLDTIENPAEIALRNLNVMVIPQIEPKLCRRAERLGEPKRSIGGNAGLLGGDALDPSARQAASLGQSTRRHLQRNQELLPQNLSGMHGLELLGHRRVLSSRLERFTWSGNRGRSSILSHFPAKNPHPGPFRLSQK
jgi:hypothetical protein